MVTPLFGLPHATSSAGPGSSVRHVPERTHAIRSEEVGFVRDTIKAVNDITYRMIQNRSTGNARRMLRLKLST
jgi:hypothetical protein